MRTQKLASQAPTALPSPSYNQSVLQLQAKINSQLQLLSNHSDLIIGSSVGASRRFTSRDIKTNCLLALAELRKVNKRLGGVSVKDLMTIFDQVYQEEQVITVNRPNNQSNLRLNLDAFNQLLKRSPNLQTSEAAVMTAESQDTLGFLIRINGLLDPLEDQQPTEDCQLLLKTIVDKIINLKDRQNQQSFKESRYSKYDSSESRSIRVIRHQRHLSAKIDDDCFQDKVANNESHDYSFYSKQEKISSTSSNKLIKRSIIKEELPSKEIKEMRKLLKDCRKSLKVGNNWNEIASLKQAVTAVKTAQTKVTSQKSFTFLKRFDNKLL